MCRTTLAEEESTESRRLRTLSRSNVGEFLLDQSLAQNWVKVKQDKLSRNLDRNQ